MIRDFHGKMLQNANRGKIQTNGKRKKTPERTLRVFCGYQRPGIAFGRRVFETIWSSDYRYHKSFAVNKQVGTPWLSHTIRYVSPTFDIPNSTLYHKNIFRGYRFSRFINSIFENFVEKYYQVIGIIIFDEVRISVWYRPVRWRRSEYADPRTDPRSFRVTLRPTPVLQDISGVGQTTFKDRTRTYVNKTPTSIGTFRLQLENSEWNFP